MAKMNFVKVMAVYKHHTQNSVLIAKDDEEVWVPRSTLSMATDEAVEDMRRGEEYTFSIDSWAATSKGLA